LAARGGPRAGRELVQVRGTRKTSRSRVAGESPYGHLNLPSAQEREDVLPSRGS